MSGPSSAAQAVDLAGAWDDEEGFAAEGDPKGTKRKSKACDSCHRQRAKCAGEQPCQRCAAAGEICTYDRPVLKRGPKFKSEKENIKRARQLSGPSANYAAGPIGGPAVFSSYPPAGHSEHFPLHVPSIPSGLNGSHPHPTWNDPRIADTSRKLPGLVSMSRVSPDRLSGPHQSRAEFTVHGDNQLPYASPPGNVSPIARLSSLSTEFLAEVYGVFRGYAWECVPILSMQSFDRAMDRWRQQQALDPSGLPPSVIPASCGAGAYILSRSPFVPEMGPYRTPDDYADLACEMLSLAAKSVASEMAGGGYTMVRPAPGQPRVLQHRDPQPDKYTVISAFILGIIASSSLDTIDNGQFYSQVAVNLAKSLGMNREVSNMEMTSSNWVEKEENTRVWWTLFHDHSILPFWNNTIPVISEADCGLCLPCPDPIYAAPAAPPPPPIPAQLAFALLTPDSNSTETLRSLFASGRTGISGFSIVLHAILYRLSRLKRARASFPGDGAAAQWEREEKDRIDRQFKVWYDALPESVLATDRRSADEGIQRRGAIDSRTAVLFILYHTYNCLLFGRWDVSSMVFDDEWLLSEDFLHCVDHANRATRLIELVIDPMGRRGGSGAVAKGDGELVRWASPYVLGATIMMGSMVHAAVLRKLRMVNPGVLGPNAPGSSSVPTSDDVGHVRALEMGLIRKLEMHVSLVEDLTSTWARHTYLWDTAREAFIDTYPGTEPSEGAKVLLTCIDFSPMGKGLVGLFATDWPAPPRKIR